MEFMNAALVDPAAPSFRPFSFSALSSSSREVVSLTDIKEQLQHMCADFGSRLDHLSIRCVR